MKIKNKIIILGLIILGLVVAIFAWNWYQGREYTVVYLSTGEVYVGKISYFPRLQLADPYAIRSVPDPKDATRTTSQLVSLKDLVWSPKRLYINPKNVIFIAPMNADGEATKALKQVK